VNVSYDEFVRRSLERDEIGDVTLRGERRWRVRSTVAGWLVSFAVSTSSLPAFAQDDGASRGEPADEVTERDERDLQKARQLYEQGVEAYERRRYDEAIDLFKRANLLAPNAAFSFNIGIAYQDAGNVALALRHYRDYLRQVPDAPDRASVLARIKGLEAKLVAVGVQQVTVVTQPANAAIAIDGKPVGLSPWTGELTPGNHELSVELSGHQNVTRDFDLPPAHAIDVSVTLEEKVDAGPAEVARPTTPAVDPSWYEDVRPVTWAVLGVGVVALGVAGYADYTRGSAQEDLSKATSASEQRTLADTVASRRSWAESFVMLGLGMVASGGALIYSDVVYARNERQRQSAFVGMCLHTGCALRYSTTF